MLQQEKQFLEKNNNFPHLSEGRRVTIKNEKKQMTPENEIIPFPKCCLFGVDSLSYDEYTPCLEMQHGWVGGAVKTTPHSQALFFILVY